MNNQFNGLPDNSLSEKKINPQYEYGAHPWKKYLPSKKIQIVIGVLLLIAIIFAGRNAIVGFFKRITTRQLAINVIPAPTTSQTRTELSVEKDTDGDGILDWQETLIGTDPAIPNSKEDFPDDVINLINTPGTIETSDKLALAIYQRAKTEPVGNTIEEQVAAAATKEILDFADSIDKQLTTYGYDDLNIVDESSQARASYKIQITSLFKKITLTPETLEKMYTAVLQNQAFDQKLFSAAINQATITELIEMEVPIKLAEQHLIFTNAVTHMFEILQKATRSDADKDESVRYGFLLVFQKNFNLVSKMPGILMALI
jgi:hypothetical protein